MLLIDIQQVLLRILMKEFSIKKDQVKEHTMKIVFKSMTQKVIFLVLLDMT